MRLWQSGVLPLRTLTGRGTYKNTYTEDLQCAEEEPYAI